MYSTHTHNTTHITHESPTHNTPYHTPGTHTITTHITMPVMLHNTHHSHAHNTYTSYIAQHTCTPHYTPYTTNTKHHIHSQPSTTHTHTHTHHITPSTVWLDTCRLIPHQFREMKTEPREFPMRLSSKKPDSYP